MATQIMVAAFPLLLHPSGARGLDAAIIGFGSGVTVGAALQFPLRSVEVIELERSVLEASRLFADVNHLRFDLPRFPYVSTPRLRVINDDGRNYLASTNKQFDVIISEPSNPWLTGVSDLFTVDHFRVAKRRLRASGVYCEWVQLYEMSPQNVKSIYRTFASQFRYVMVFSADDLSSDTVLVGSDSPLTLDLPRLQRAFGEAAVAAELKRAAVGSAFDVFARVLLASKRELTQYAQLESHVRQGRIVAEPGSTNAGPCKPPDCRREPAPLNTDDNALIEFSAPRDLIGFERYKGYLEAIYGAGWPYGVLQPQLRGFGNDAQGADDYAELSMALLGHGRKREAAAALALAMGTGSTGRTAVARAMLTALGPDAQEPPLGLQPPRPDAGVSTRADQRIADAYVEVMDWLRRGDVQGARRAIEALPSSLLRYSGASMRYLRAYVLYRAGAHELAVGDLEAIAREEPAFLFVHPELHFYLGRAHDGLLHWDKAVRNIRMYVEAAVLGLKPAADEPEPSPASAPTSDRPGTSDKRRGGGAGT
jgi:spermidine synthase